MNRICVYNKDVQQITGKSERHCREIIKKIRQLKNKQNYQPITVLELCEYLGIDADTILSKFK